MTMQELFDACSKLGHFPRVEFSGEIERATSKQGVVTQIRNDGCAVRFEGMGYDKWFHKVPDTDKRSKYMVDLKLIYKAPEFVEEHFGCANCGNRIGPNQVFCHICKDEM